MIITRKWLEQYIDLRDISNSEIAVALNSLGFEVESVVDYANNTNLVCGKVDVVNKIENTHLHFCLVDTKKDLVDPIVCGADNVREEMFTIVATPGSKLLSGKTIEKTVIKGHESEGMLCGIEDLGISKSLVREIDDGIIDLVEDFDVSYDDIGQNVNDKLWLNDCAFDVDLTLNRSDCLSSYELARELSNYFKKPLKELAIKSKQGEVITSSKLDLLTDTNELNVAIVASVMLNRAQQDLKLPFKTWWWLKISGYNADLNNPLIDLAAQAAIETGQPILIYDRSKIKSKLVITDKYENKELDIVKGELVILDGKEFVEVVGVKTNPNYLVTPQTKEIAILSLHFNHTAMRLHQKKYGVSNLNLQRFIKPLSKGISSIGFGRYLSLLDNYNLIASVDSLEYYKETDAKTAEIIITSDYISNIIGVQFTDEKVSELLEPLNFTITKQTDHLVVKPPFTRIDIVTPADIAEEIARLYGYDNIPSVPPVLPNIKKDHDIVKNTLNILTNYLIAHGYYQTKTYSLVSAQEINEFNIFNYSAAFKVLSPISSEHQFMRLSLLNSLFEVVRYNNAHNQYKNNFFTIEKIYHENNKVGQYHLAFVAQDDVIESKVMNQKINNSYYYIKAIVESLLKNNQIVLDKVSYQYESSLPWAHPYQTAKVIYNSEQIGLIGALHPEYLATFNIKPIYFAELRLDILFDKTIRSKSKYQKINKYSASYRDLSLVINKDVLYQDFAQEMLNNTKYVVDTQVIDRYEGEHIEDGKYGLTVKIIFNSEEKQLSDKEIDQDINVIIENLNHLKINIR